MRPWIPIDRSFSKEISALGFQPRRGYGKRVAEAVKHALERRALFRIRKRLSGESFEEMFSKEGRTILVEEWTREIRPSKSKSKTQPLCLSSDSFLKEIPAVYEDTLVKVLASLPDEYFSPFQEEERDLATAIGILSRTAMKRRLKEAKENGQPGLPWYVLLAEDLCFGDLPEDYYTKTEFWNNHRISRKEYWRGYAAIPVFLGLPEKEQRGLWNRHLIRPVVEETYRMEVGKKEEAEKMFNEILDEILKHEGVKE